jgi:hypothetical protein
VCAIYSLLAFYTKQLCEPKELVHDSRDEITNSFQIRITPNQWKYFLDFRSVLLVSVPIHSVITQQELGLPECSECLQVIDYMLEQNMFVVVVDPIPFPQLEITQATDKKVGNMLWP